jgi:hypothetical protein
MFPRIVLQTLFRPLFGLFLTVDYLPVATGAGNLVDPQPTFAGSSYQTAGFQVGLAIPSQMNKVVRQSSMVAAALANFISQKLNISVVDDGNLSNLITLFSLSIAIGSNKIVAVAFSATPIFDASQGNIFEITLTGNVTSSTLVNVSPGMDITFIIHQDSTGGRTFVPPANAPIGNISTVLNKTTTQTFVVDAGSVLRPTSAPSVS